jgi:predicted transcriptional regulator
MKLNIIVGEPLDIALARLRDHARKIDSGKTIEPLCEVGFAHMAQMSELFTPKHWELVATLKATGAQSIYALAKSLNRHYRNVKQDVTTLIEWLVIEKDGAGNVFVPWDEISVQFHLQKRRADDLFQ